MIKFVVRNCRLRNAIEDMSWQDADAASLLTSAENFSEKHMLGDYDKKPIRKLGLVGRWANT